MKVTGIRHEKHRSDGTGVIRVLVSYEAEGGNEKTATLLCDMFEDTTWFESAAEARRHRAASGALGEIARAYMTLVYHGWEG